MRGGALVALPLHAPVPFFAGVLHFDCGETPHHILWCFPSSIPPPARPEANIAIQLLKGMKIMVELSKQLGNAAVFTGKSADPLMAHPLARTKEELCTGLPEVLQAQQSQTRKVRSVLDNLMKEALKHFTCISGKLQQEVPQGQKVPQGSQSQNFDTFMKEASERDNIPRKIAMS